MGMKERKMKGKGSEVEVDAKTFELLLVWNWKRSV